MDEKKRIADFLFEVGHLARTARSGFALLGTEPQSVAAHSFRAAVVGYVLGKMTPGANAERVALMCLLHDLPEARIGDPHALAKRYLRFDEEEIVADQTRELPFGEELRELFGEYAKRMSLEGELAKDADQLELLLTLREQEGRGETKASEWLEPTISRLRTDGARELAQGIVGGDPCHWWERLTAESRLIDDDITSD